MKSKTVMFAGVAFALIVPVCEAQLFKGGQRRAARQGGGSTQQSGGNLQQGGANQQPRTGLFGKEKAPKTGGLFKGKQDNQQPINNGQYQQPKTGMFGKQKEPQNGGLFNRNKIEYSDGQYYKEKTGLFGKAKAKREQAAVPQQRYTQQQFNQQASVNSVQRSQRASSNQPLFQNKAVGNFNNPASANSGSNGLLSSSLGQPSASQAALAAIARSRQQVDLTAEDQKSQLPELTRIAEPKQTQAARSQKPRATVRSKPKLPQRRSPLTNTVKHAQLQDTSNQIPQASPTGLIPPPPVVDVSTAMTLA